MKEGFGTAEPSPLALISPGTASAFHVGKFKSSLVSQPPSSVLHWLVIHSGVGWEEGGKSPLEQRFRHSR